MRIGKSFEHRNAHTIFPKLERFVPHVYLHSETKTEKNDTSFLFLFPFATGLISFSCGNSYGVAAVALHGRSRKQRYSKLADWDYIGECKRTTNLPVLGNGDIYNWEQAMEMKKKSGMYTIFLWYLEGSQRDSFDGDTALCLNDVG